MPTANLSSSLDSSQSVNKKVPSLHEPKQPLNSSKNVHCSEAAGKLLAQTSEIPIIYHCGRRRHQYNLSLIGNADQTPLTFDMLSNTTVNSKGTKMVSIVMTGHEKDRFTVMLACLGNGSKLPSYVVFKRETLSKG